MPKTKKKTTQKTRLRALRGFDYPDEKGLAMVKKAGGRSRLTEEQQKELKDHLVRFEVGDWCDGLPKYVPLESLLANGTLEEVEV